MGTLRINIGSNARSTLLPVFVPAATYSASAVPTGGGGATVTEDPFTTGSTLTLLQNVEYAVTVIGYCSNSNPVAMGNATVELTGASATQAITMREIDVGTHNGTFSYNFNNHAATATADSATMTFTRLGPAGTGSAPSPIDISASNSLLSTPVNAGYYLVSATFVKANHFDITRQQIVHIYSGMTSNWNFNDAINFVSNQVTITFDAESGNTVTESGGQTHPVTVAHGTAITTSPTAVHSTSATNAFDGWFTVTGGTGTRWTFGTGGRLVLSARTLFAHYTAVSTGNLTVNLTELANLNEVTGEQTAFEGAAATGITIAKDDFELATDNTSTIRTITVTNTGPVYEQVMFFINGVDASSLVSGNVLTIDFFDSSLDSTFSGLRTVGNHYVMVRVRNIASGKLYSVNLLITITP